MAQHVMRNREVEHLSNMRRLDEEDRRTIEHLAAKWSRDRDAETLPASVIPIRPKAA